MNFTVLNLGIYSAQTCDGLPVFENDPKLKIRSKILKMWSCLPKKIRLHVKFVWSFHNNFLLNPTCCEWIFQLLKIFNFMSNTRYLDWCSKQKSRKIHNFHIFMYIWLEWGTRRSMGFPTGYWTPPNSFWNPRTKDWCACSIKVISTIVTKAFACSFVVTQMSCCETQ